MPTQILHKDVHSRFFHNCNLKTIKKSFSRWWINKLVLPNNGILFSIKQKMSLSSHEKTWKNLQYILLNEGTNLQGLHPE